MQIEADEGSPIPSSRVAEVEVSGPWKDLQGKAEQYRQIAPVYSMGHLFTDKELVLTQQDASYSAIQELLAKRRKTLKEQRINGNPADIPQLPHEDITLTLRPDTSLSKLTKNGRGKTGKAIRNGSGAPTTANVTDAEDNDLAQVDGNHSEEMEDAFLVAPAMDRTISSSIPTTRSTRNQANPLASNGDATSWHHLGDLAGRASAVRLLGTYSKETKKKEDEWNRPPPLTEQEIEDDFAMIAAAVKEEEREPGKMNKELVAELLAGREADYVGGWPAGSRRVSIDM